MKLQKPGSETRRRFRAWLTLVLMSLAILVSLPFTPALWAKAGAVMGRGINNSGYIVSFFLLALIGVYMLFRFRKYGPLNIVFLSVLAVGYWYLLKYYCRFPAEKFHLLEYGLLAFLAYRAFHVDFSRVVSFVCGFLFASAFGVVDELVQYVLPNRHFELRDIGTNIFGSALGLLVVAILMSPYMRRTAATERQE